MNHRINFPVRCALVLVSAFFTWPALADFSVISGRLYSDAPKVSGPGADCEPGSHLYATVGPIQVSQSGDYRYVDGSNYVGLDITLAVYSAPFNAGSPNANLVGDWDDTGEVPLTSGTDYYLLIQPWCGDPTGTWAAALSGPGEVSGEGVVAIPGTWQGNFDGTEGVTDTTPEFSGCEATYYQVNGPVQVPNSGTYYYSDLSNWYDVTLQFAVYDDVFDPGSPYDNQIASVIFGANIELEAGTDYYFVTQPLCEDDTGEWAYLLFPPNPFEVTPGVNGSWFNDATPGQGFFLDVFPLSGVVFYAEFAWDTTKSAGGDSTVGDAGTRWFIATAPFEHGVNSLEFTVYKTAGGVYNSDEPVSETEAGSVVLDFDNCGGGMRSFDLTDGPKGSVPFGRIAADNMPECEESHAGPGVIIAQ